MAFQLNGLPKELQEMYERLHQQNNDGTDQDMIPGGLGEFGLEITNPIPTDTIIGSALYLTMLSTADGRKVQNERMGSNNAPNIKKPIDLYRVMAEGGESTILYISPYQKKNSNQAPKGFKLV